MKQGTAVKRVDPAVLSDDRPQQTSASTVVPPAHTDWLRNRLTVSGPAAAVGRFRDAAQGTGGIPWHLDLDHEEARLLAPMAKLGAEAQAQARELGEVIAARHDRLLARWQERGARPLDLHRLVPIPEDILRQGEDAPAAHAWLWSHWGTAQPLRQVRIVAENGDRRLRRSARLSYEFYAADWTPWQVILRLRRDWPRLVFAITPHYDEPGGPAERWRPNCTAISATGILASSRVAIFRRSARFRCDERQLIHNLPDPTV